jgi:hypothetical protein
MAGYSPDAPRYRIYDHATRRITTSVHVMFQDVPGFPPSMTADSMISDEPDTDSDRGSAPRSHPLDPDPRSASEALDLDRPSHLRSHPIRDTRGSYVRPPSRVFCHVLRP